MYVQSCMYMVKKLCSKRAQDECGVYDRYIDTEEDWTHRKIH